MTDQEKLELLCWLNKKMTESYIVRATSEATIYNEVYCHVENMVVSRVMTLEEVLALKENTPVYIEVWDGLHGWDVFCGTEFDTGDVMTGAPWAVTEYWPQADYLDTWRCWTAEPTESQMEETKWE